MKRGEVVALPRTKRPEDAIGYLNANLADTEALLTVRIDREGNHVWSIFGEIDSRDLALIALEMQREALE